MAEALWLSQTAATRGRAGQKKAEFLEYRMMQDSPGSGQIQRQGGERMEPSAQGVQAGGDAAGHGSGADGSESRGAIGDPDPVQRGSSVRPPALPPPRLENPVREEWATSS